MNWWIQMAEEWGYVLIPFNIRNRDDGKIGVGVLSDLHKRHLIPVVQLYDIKLNTYEKDTVDAAKFLNSFLWPVRERYISVYNEPNDAKFWARVCFCTGICAGSRLHNYRV